MSSNVTVSPQSSVDGIVCRNKDMPKPLDASRMKLEFTTVDGTRHTTVFENPFGKRYTQVFVNNSGIAGWVFGHKLDANGNVIEGS